MLNGNEIKMVRTGAEYMGEALRTINIQVADIISDMVTLSKLVAIK